MKFSTFLLLLLTATFANAQQPFSFNRTTLTHAIPTKTFSGVNVDALMAEDAANVNKDIPYRFGFKHDANLGIDNAGVTEILKDGSKLWRLELRCPNAYSINLIFDKFHLPEGSLMWLYSKDQSYVIGPYAAKNNTADKWFGSDLVKGDDIVIEYYEPYYVAFHAEVHINGVTHAYRDPFQFVKAFGQSGSCNNNVNCPVGANWQTDKRAVAIIIVNGSGFCTGSMLGNTTLDGTPYFLTANHCLGGNYSTWVYRFNYESPDCSPNTNGITTQTVNGSTLVASYAASDFGLLLLNAQPDPSYQVYYAGWNNADIPSDSLVGIHHPSGDVKKISFANGLAQNMGWSTAGTTHWYVNWNSGVTEGGSSGSPLFDKNHRVVGQLHGGPSGCGNADLHDYYGKVATSWNGGGAAASRLKDWLDPNNTGATSLNGYYASLPTDTLDVTVLSIQTPVATICDGDTVVPHVQIRNNGANTITSIVVSYSVDSGAAIAETLSVNIPLYGIYEAYLTPFVPALGAHTITVAVSNPNNGIDQEPINDDKLSTFNVINGSKVTVQIKTDDYPGETTFLLTSAAGDTVLSGGSFDTPESLYTFTACLPIDCYTFKIFDTNGDGICCGYGNGYYKIIAEDGTILNQGGQFTSQASYTLCLFNTPPQASFTSTTTGICSGQSVTFTNSSQQAGNYLWQITGPATFNSTNTNITYTLNAAGVYNIRLIAQNNIGADTSLTTITVYPTPQVSLTVTNLSGASSNDGSISANITGGTLPLTYIWSNGATTQNLSSLAAGSYSVTVTSADGCGSVKNANVVAFNAIATLDNSNFNIYPNPTTGLLSIDWTVDLPVVDIELYDGVGKRVRSFEFKYSHQAILDLNDLENGVYTLQIQNANNLLTRKVVKLEK